MLNNSYTNEFYNSWESIWITFSEYEIENLIIAIIMVLSYIKPSVSDRTETNLIYYFDIYLKNLRVVIRRNPKI